MSGLGTAEVAELRSIAEREGTLRPASVLEVARDPANVLHKHFEWDDDVAAEHYRLVQAGMLIRRARVKITPREGADAVSVRAFVSLDGDRGKAGYRSIETVISSHPFTQEMLGGALRELAAFKRKYQDLAELTDLVVEIDRLLQKVEFSNTPGSLQDAVTMAIALEQEGLDRVTAAHRAAAAHKLRGDDVVVARRNDELRGEV